MHRLNMVLLLVGLHACGHAEDFGSSDRPKPSTLVGLPCNSDSDCDQYCARGDDFPDGFCSLQRCRGNADCPKGTVCITEDKGVCVFPCAEPLDCTSDFLGRSGYTCREKSGYSSDTTSSVRYSVCLGIR